MNYQFKHIVVGGTFDLLHAGHKAFIKTAFNLASFVSIGMTTDEFNKNRNKETFQDQSTREKNLANYLAKQNFTNRSQAIFINDVFGISLNKDIDAIIVTSETAKNADIINKKRKQLNRSLLKIVRLPHLKGSDGKIISSTRIRNGEIDSEGRVYKNLLIRIADKQFGSDIIVPLKSPLGDIVTELKPKSIYLIAVGDAITRKCLSLNIIPDISFIDLKTQRKEIYNSISELGFKKTKPDTTVINKPGEISKSLIDSVDKAIHSKNKQIILIEGEEDLAVIPAVLLSPFGTKVLYGQPNVGIVEIIVNEESKDRLYEILKLK